MGFFEDLIAHYPIEVKILKQRGRVFESKKNYNDRARVVNDKGADFFELKKRRKGGERIRLDVKKFKNVVVGDFMFLFEFADGEFSPGTVEFVKEEDVIQEDGSTKVVRKVFVFPDVDPNSMVVHIQRRNQLHDRYNLPSFMKEWGPLVMLCVAGVTLIIVSWLNAGATNHNADAVLQFANVMNQTLSKALETGIVRPGAP